MPCVRCGTCCRNNGLIPPLIQTIDTEVPAWLSLVVSQLQKRLAWIAETAGEKLPCLFLLEDNRCALQEIYKPDVCVQFLCERAENGASVRS